MEQDGAPSNFSYATDSVPVVLKARNSELRIHFQCAALKQKGFIVHRQALPFGHCKQAIISHLIIRWYRRCWPELERCTNSVDGIVLFPAHLVRPHLAYFDGYPARYLQRSI